MRAFMAASYAGTDSDDVKRRAADLGAFFIGARHPRKTDSLLSEDQPMRLTKTLGMAGALLLSAVIGGTLIGSALATDEITDAGSNGAAGSYCDTFMNAFASELGTTADEVAAAGKAAANTALDAAVAAGDITAERADALRERIAAADGAGCGLFKAGWVRGFGHGAAHGFFGGDVFEAAADALGITSADLIGQLHDAGSLEALARELGVDYGSVKSAVLTAVEADLDAAVANGMSQERADLALARLTTWLDEGGEAGGHRGFGPGHGRWGERGADDTDAEDSGA
jgi:hypothetical protein